MKPGKPVAKVHGSWPLLLVASVVLLSAVDAGILQASRGYFTTGYNGYALHGPANVGLYVLLSLLMDATLVLLAWLLLLPVLRRVFHGPRQRAVGLALGGLVLPLALDSSFYGIYQIMGDLLGLRGLWQLSMDSGTVGLQAIEYLPGLVALWGAGIAGAALLLWLARRRDAHAVSYDFRRHALSAGALGLAFAAASVSGGVLLYTAGAARPGVWGAVSAKASTQVITRVVSLATDFDRDGTGFLARPWDSAPFNPHVYPSALDIPGNGLDENGLAGDLPAGFPAPLPVPVVPSAGTRRPDFLLVLLEGVRADAIDQRLDGRLVMPVLDGLAHRFGHSEHAFAHTPRTAGSRAQLFGGRLIRRPDASTLVDDFKARGYFVAWFSGQDDSYMGSERLLGFDRADLFFDAREEVERRSTGSSSPSSLQISRQVLMEHVESFLQTYDGRKPLFLYVNVVDSHFPYWHEGMQHLFTSEVPSRWSYRSDHAARLRRIYWNSLANVDLALGRLFQLWEGRRPPEQRAFLMTSDHGEALYDHGMLGHGLSLDGVQTRVPFIVGGLSGAWPEPLGLADVRGLLVRDLFSPPRALAYPKFRPVPGRSIFQFLGWIDRPMQIGVRNLAGVTIYRPLNGQLEEMDSSDVLKKLTGDETAAAMRHVVHAWEAVRVADAEKPGSVSNDADGKASDSGLSERARGNLDR